MKSIENVINNNAELHGDKTAFVYKNKRTTFITFRERVNRLVNGLDSLGVRKGDRVAILSQNRPEYFEIYCSVKGGFIIVPLNVGLNGKELVDLINNSGAETLFIEKKFIRTLESIRHEISNVRNIIIIGGEPGYIEYEEMLKDASSVVRNVEIKDEDLCCLIYTSGTTGTPKGAMHTHRGVLNIALSQSIELKMSVNHIALHIMPFFHIGGVWNTLFPCFAIGMTNIIDNKFMPVDFLSLLEKYRVTRTFLVPTMIITLLEELSKNDYDISSLDLLQYAASPMPVETLKRAMKAFPNCGFLQQYGSTETPGCTLSDEDHRHAIEEKESLLRSCGRPWPEVEVKIMREDGTVARIGEIGEIAFKTNMTMAGYWRNEDETNNILRDKWLFTGDMGRLDSDGYLYISDRKKDMIITGGENVYPTEVENVLFQHPLVLECCVIGIPDKKWIEAVKAIVVLRAGAKITDKEIISFCKSRMAGYKCPKSVNFVATLPKSRTGKVLRRVLKEDMQC